MLVTKPFSIIFILILRVPVFGDWVRVLSYYGLANVLDHSTASENCSWIFQVISFQALGNIYILLYDLTYNTHGYFASRAVFFPSPEGARKTTSKEQNVRSYYMLNYTISYLLFHLLRHFVVVRFQFF